MFLFLQGGVVAKRLLAYEKTINITNIAITLASPLDAPVINTDMLMNNYYKVIETEWEENINSKPDVKNMKMLLSFGNGARDFLMPSWLTSSNDSDVHALVSPFTQSKLLSSSSKRLKYIASKCLR